MRVYFCSSGPSTSPTENITKIARRELEAIAPSALVEPAPEWTSPSVPLIQAVVRQELANNGISTVCSFARQITLRSVPTTVGPCDYVQRRFQMRNPGEWLTPDDRPICFQCSRVGPVVEYCRSRWISSPSDFSLNPRYQADRPHRFSPRPQSHADADAQPSRFSCRSPFPRRRQQSAPSSFVSADLRALFVGKLTNAAEEVRLHQGFCPQILY